MSKNTKIILSITLLLFLLSVAVFYYSSIVFLQLFIAFALSYILNPTVESLERKGVKRQYGIVLILFPTIMLCTVFAVFFVVLITGEFSNMELNLPAYAHHLYEVPSPSVKTYLGVETTDELALRLNELLQQARNTSPDLLKPLLAFVQRALTSTVSMLLAVLGYLIIPVYLFYLLYDLLQLKSFIESFIPERFRTAYAAKLAEVDVVPQVFLRSLALYYRNSEFYREG